MRLHFWLYSMLTFALYLLFFAFLFPLSPIDLAWFSLIQKKAHPSYTQLLHQASQGEKRLYTLTEQGQRNTLVTYDKATLQVKKTPLMHLEETLTNVECGQVFFSNRLENSSFFTAKNAHFLWNQQKITMQQTQFCLTENKTPNAKISVGKADQIHFDLLQQIQLQSAKNIQILLQK